MAVTKTRESSIEPRDALETLKVHVRHRGSHPHLCLSRCLPCPSPCPPATPSPLRPYSETPSRLTTTICQGHRDN
ncbi:hypothetical protein E2C01_086809 [Portunus trituberculatus]|uniref:Uncharacterized protein n=1 Tax=Portunus trituberculatus TaxID=210409 RepID=A0A5B7J6C9_PORTR|nr:hypothetical protein [Portunus trituberculatus]